MLSEQAPRPEYARWSALFASGLRARFLLISTGIASYASGSFLAATALPSAALEIGGVDEIGWAFSLYFLAAIISGTISTAIQARLGWRYALLGAAVVFLAGTLVVVAAASMSHVLLGRALQGAGHGTMAAVCYGLIPVSFPESFVPKIFAAESVVWAAAAFAGPAAAGYLADQASWRMAFLVNLPVLAMFLGLVISEPSAGSFLPTTAPLPRTSSPALPPMRLFSPATVTGCGLWGVFLMTVASGSVSAFLAFTVQVLWSFSAAAAGYAHALLTLSWGVVALVAAHGSLSRFGPVFIRIGPILVTVGLAGILAAIRLDSAALVYPAQVTIGAGFGVSWGYLNQALMAAASDDDRSAAATLLPTAHSAGLVGGTAIAAVVAQAFGLSRPEDASFALSWVFGIGFLFSLSAWGFCRSAAEALHSGRR